MIVHFGATNAVYNGEEPVSVTAIVKNVGTQPATVNTMHFRYNTTNRTLTGDSASDQPFNATGLPPGQTGTIQIDWEPTHEQRGPGTLIGTVDSQTESEANASHGNRADTPIFITDRNASLDPIDDEPGTGFPGRWTAYRVNVTNNGNVPTTYDLNTTGYQDENEEDGPRAWTLPDDWQARTSHDVLHLEPSQTRTIVTLVRPSDDAPPPDVANASLNASISGPIIERNVSLKLPRVVVATQLPDDFSRAAGLQPVQTHRFVGPDLTPYETQWRLTNEGSQREAYTFEATVEGELAPILNVTSPRMVALPPGNSTLVNVTVTPTEPTTVGADATLELAARSVNLADGQPGATAKQALTASGPNLAVMNVTVPEPVYTRDGIASLSVDLANTGNLPAPATNLTVRVVRSGFVTQRTTTPVPGIQPGDAASVPIELPIDDLAGAYVLEIEANHPSQFGEIQRTDNQATDDIDVRDVGLSVVPAQTLEVTPGAFARFVRPPHLFQVVNQGNAREPVEIHIESQHGWMEDARTITVDPGAREGIPLELGVPSYPGVARDEIRVTAHLVNATSVTASNATVLTLTDEDAPTLENVTLPDTVQASLPFNVTATLQDALGIGEAWATHTAPNGAQDRVTLAPAGGDRFTANLTFYELGEHTFSFHARDRSAANNTFHDPRQHTIEVVYTQTPTIRLEHPTTGALRAGEPIDLDIEDRVGLSSVNASIRGRSFQLQGDMSINTTGWRQGTYTLSVEAANRYGLTNATTFDVTIDNTPPDVTDVTIDPAEPAPGDDVTITATVEGDVHHVEATFNPESGQATTIQLESSDSGYVGQVTLAAGTYTVGLRAVDAAGNVGSPGDPVEVQVRADSPAPAIALVLATLAGLATLASRREATR